jgi:ATP-dependent exoDNAse (exonuclease V) beta subunit
MGRRPNSRRGEQMVFDRRAGIAARVGQDSDAVKPPLYVLSGLMHGLRDEEERARMLYVALTRARDWLVLSSHSDPDKRSWMALVGDLFGLQERAHDAHVEGQGWRMHLVRECGELPTPGSNGSARPDIDLVQLAAQAAPLPEPQAPPKRWPASILSHLMAGEAPEGRPEHAADGGEDDRLNAVVRGNAVHRLFEEWDLRGDPAPVIEAVLAVEAPSISDRRQLRPYLAERAERFRQSPLGERAASELGIEREAVFQLRIGDGERSGIVSGAVDLLFSDGTVVDYKTGHPDEETLRAYEWQVRLYASALQRLRGQRAPAGYLYLVDADALHPVDVSDVLLQKALEKALDAMEANVSANAALR